MKLMTQNERIILTLLITQGPLTKRQIETQSGLAWATVSKLMTRLENLEIVERQGLSPDNSGGKNAYLFHVSSTRPLSLGIDIEYTTTEMIVVNLKDEIIARTSFPTPQVEDEEIFFSQLIHQLKSFIAQFGVPLATLHGVGIGMPGWLFGTRAVDFVRISELLTKELAKPVLVVNNIRAYVASVLRRQDTPPHFMLVTLRTGIGVGIVINGERYPGESDLAGSIGHIRFDPARSSLCRCGQQGCLESYTNYPTLAKTARTILQRNQDISETQAIHELFNLAHGGHEGALQAIRSFAQDLSLGIASLLGAFNIKTLYITSDFGPYGQLLADSLKEITAEQVLHTIEFSISYQPMVEERFLFGAAHLVLNSFCDFTRTPLRA